MRVGRPYGGALGARGSGQGEPKLGKLGWPGWRLRGTRGGRGWAGDVEMERERGGVDLARLQACGVWPDFLGSWQSHLPQPGRACERESGLIWAPARGARREEQACPFPSYNLQHSRSPTIFSTRFNLQLSN